MGDGVEALVRALATTLEEHGADQELSGDAGNLATAAVEFLYSKGPVGNVSISDVETPSKKPQDVFAKNGEWSIYVRGGTVTFTAPNRRFGADSPVGRPDVASEILLGADIVEDPQPPTGWCVDFLIGKLTPDAQSHILTMRTAQRPALGTSRSELIDSLAYARVRGDGGRRGAFWCTNDAEVWVSFDTAHYGGARPTATEVSILVVGASVKEGVVPRMRESAFCISADALNQDARARIESLLDPVNPTHYKVGGIEVIDAIEAWGLGFSRGNALKHLARAGREGAADEIADLEKAAWYIAREIGRLKRDG